MALKSQVEAVLNQVRPMLQQDGGDVELVDVTEDGTVQVKLTGACGTCQYALMTLKHGIESRLKEAIPGIKEVVSV